VLISRVEELVCGRHTAEARGGVVLKNNPLYYLPCAFFVHVAIHGSEKKCVGSKKVMGGTRVLLQGPHLHKEPKSIYRFLCAFGDGTRAGGDPNSGRRYKGVRLVDSPLPSKKLRIIYPNGEHRDFGATGYSDYTKHKSVRRRARYRKRHRKDPIDDPFTPGALSWHILWGDSTSLSKNFRVFVNKFKKRLRRKRI
jgi:hypothetical protein